MGYAPFSEGWVRAWRGILNRSDAYRRAARSWKWPVVLVMLRDPTAGIDEDRAVYLDLRHGVCHEARVASPEDQAQALYVLAADPWTWKRVVDGELEPIAGVLRRKIRLVKGNPLTLAAHARAAMCLVKTAREVDTAFPEQMRAPRP